jgi:hypothetical protein
MAIKTEAKDVAAVELRMLEMAEAQGLIGAEWRVAWWRDKARLEAALDALGEAGSVRLHVAGHDDRAGSVWAGIHPVTGRAMLFSASGAGAASGRGVMPDAGAAAKVRKAEKGRWLTWWDALNAMNKGKGRGAPAPVAVGEWVGGVTKQGAVLGMVVEITKEGVPVQLQADGDIMAAPAGVRWFAWRGEARIAAAKSLAYDGESLFPSYLAMRSKVVARARTLLKAGEVANDDDKPIVIEWRKAPRGKRAAPK